MLLSVAVLLWSIQPCIHFLPVVSSTVFLERQKFPSVAGKLLNSKLENEQVFSSVFVQEGSIHLGSSKR